MNTFDLFGFFAAVILTVVGSAFAMKKQKRRSKDGYIVKQLEDGGVDVLKKQQLEFWFYSNDEQAIKNVEIELINRDFDVILNQTDEDPCYVICAFKDMIPDISELQALRKEFQRFARLHGAKYDGWGYSGEGKTISQD